MTSNPPSRSARAIIFAPRSCPSSPGFATRILSLLSAMSLDPARVAIDPELLAKDVAYLTHGRLAADRFQYRLHQVLTRTARLGHPRQRLTQRNRVAIALHLAHALHL